MSADPITPPDRPADMPPKTTHLPRVIILVLALILIAIFALFKLWPDGQAQAEEQQAVRSLQQLGAIVVLDSNQRPASINLSTLQSPKDLAQAMKLLPKLAHATSLDVSRTTISDDQVRFIAQMHGLNSLSLNATAIGDAGVQQLRTLEALQSLYLASTGVTERSLPAIAELDQLRILDLSAAKVSANLEPLAELPQLEWLVMRKLSLEDSALPSLGGSESLKRLSLEESNYAEDSLTALQQSRPELSADR